MFCPHCGFKNDGDATFCQSCGSKMNGKTTIIYPDYMAKYNPWAVAGFVLSLINIFLGSLFIPGVLGLIFSSMGYNQINELGGRGKGLAIAGIVVSIITLAGYILMFLLVIGLAGCMVCPISYLI